MKKFIIFCLSLCFLLSCSNSKVDNSVVKEFDMERFTGDWYEIARFDHHFEHGMDYVKSNFVIDKDGSIIMTNYGIREGQMKMARGIAKQTDTPGLLDVTMWKLVFADYRVMLLDENYQYALVSSGGEKCLWLLARTPQISDDVKNILTQEAERRGYDVAKLIWVKQK